MASASEILDEITRAMEREIKKFDRNVPGIERLIYKRAVDLLKDLKVINGKIVNSVENIKAINKLRLEIESFILDRRYINSTKSFLTAFDMIEELQRSYFSSLSVEVGRTRLLTAIKNDAINYTAKELTTQGVNSKVMPGIERLLRINITQGGSVADLMEELRRYITTTTDSTGKTTHGALQRHTRQITTDALNQFSANYNETITQDLGFNWRVYRGTLLETSREWCIHMVKKRYVHVSELNTVINDNIDGVKICSEKIPCDKKTKLPKGMIEGTDASNISQRRGGWQCGHQFGGVPDAVVPQHLRDKFKDAPNASNPPKSTKSSEYTPEQIARAKHNYGNFLRHKTLSDYDVETMGRNEAERRMDYHNRIVDGIRGGDKNLEREWKKFFLNEQAKADQKAAESKAKMAANKAASADVLAPIKALRKLVEFGKWLNTPGNPYRSQYFSQKYTKEAVNEFMKSII